MTRLPSANIPALTRRATLHRSPQRERRDPSPRFTLDGSDELEKRLAAACLKIAAGVRGLLPPRKLQALLLGGGYGRGEGGVWRSPEGDRPYNDLEFYVYLRGSRHFNEWLYGRALHVLGEILTPQIGIDVEFKIASLRELARAPVSMFSYDLVSGHHRLVGEERLLRHCVHHREAEQIPLGEATRLLMNRCSGLLFALERLQRPVFTAADSDFTRRNIAKAELALGDAVLVTYGQYHWSVQERHARLERIARVENTRWLSAVCQHHAAGVEFKLHPERSTAERETLQRYHADVSGLAQQTWLWLESRRLSVPFWDIRNYADNPLNKWPEAGPWRSALMNLKTRGVFSGLHRSANEHPRSRLLSTLARLLWDPTALTTPASTTRVQRDLRTNARDFSGVVAAYTALWSRLN